MKRPLIDAQAAWPGIPIADRDAALAPKFEPVGRVNIASGTFVEEIDYSKFPVRANPFSASLPPCGNATHFLNCLCHIGDQMQGVTREKHEWQVSSEPQYTDDRAFLFGAAMLDDAQAYADTVYLRGEIEMLRARASALRILEERFCG